MPESSETDSRPRLQSAGSRRAEPPPRASAHLLLQPLQRAGHIVLRDLHGFGLLVLLHAEERLGRLRAAARALVRQRRPQWCARAPAQSSKHPRNTRHGKGDRHGGRSSPTSGPRDPCSAMDFLAANARCLRLAEKRNRLPPNCDAGAAVDWNENSDTSGAFSRESPRPSARPVANVHGEGRTVPCRIPTGCWPLLRAIPCRAAHRPDSARRDTNVFGWIVRA